MRGSIRRHGKAWQGRVDVGLDPQTSKRKITYVKGNTKKACQEQIAEIVAKVTGGEYVDPSKTTLGEWLDTWFETAIDGVKRPRTAQRYRGIIDRHLKPGLGDVVLQKLQAVNIEVTTSRAHSRARRCYFTMPSFRRHSNPQRARGSCV